MQNTRKKLNNKIKVVSNSFTGGNITKYSGINKIVKFFQEARNKSEVK